MIKIMCDFKFLDFSPAEIIKIMEYDVKLYQKKFDYHTGIAKSYGMKIEELEGKIGRLHQKIRKENKN